MAEAYWDKEWELQQQGFDYCYDKRLYDRLEHDAAESVRLHLCADLRYQDKLVRFIENHDEPRAALIFPPDKARAAAVTTATLPGAKLFHEGQFEGRRVKSLYFCPAGRTRFRTLNFSNSIKCCSKPSGARISGKENGNCATAPAGRTTPAT